MATKSTLVRTPRNAGRVLEANGGRLRLTLVERGGTEKEIDLPTGAQPLFEKVLRELENGRQVIVLSSEAEVSTQQAAEYLNVSRPFFVKLLDAGKLPSRRVGPRRRVRVRDLIEYRDREEAERHRGLDELAAEAQKLGFY